jgi:hypothetical protein
MRNLCRLAPGLHRLAVYDNSKPLDARQRPDIRRLLHVVNGKVQELDRDMPEWAKPVAAVCLNKATRQQDDSDNSDANG